MGKCFVTILWKMAFAGVDHMPVTHWWCEQLLKLSVFPAESMQLGFVSFWILWKQQLLFMDLDPFYCVTHLWRRSVLPSFFIKTCPKVVHLGCFWCIYPEMFFSELCIVETYFFLSIKPDILSVNHKYIYHLEK